MKIEVRHPMPGGPGARPAASPAALPPPGSASPGNAVFPGGRQRWAWILVAICFVLVMVLTYKLQRQALDSAQAQFERRVSEITTAITDRMGTYEQVLRGGLGLFQASDQVTRAEWHNYVEALNLAERYPGIQGMGYSQWIPPERLRSHEEELRAEGFSDYRVHPVGRRDAYTAVIYLEPFDARNRKAFGFDMWSEAVRRQAMQRAVDTAETTISGRVTLVQEIDADVQAGFLMYLPLYRGFGPPQDVTARSDALSGFVYSPFRMRDLMRGVVGDLDDIRLRIYDGNIAAPEALMFDSAAGAEGEAMAEPRFSGTRLLPIRSATWTMSFETLPAFRRGSGTDALPIYAMAAGLVGCALFGFVVRSWGAMRSSAAEIAAGMVRSLDRQTEELLRSNAELEQFAYVASHDLRSPLRNMNFLISWLSEDHSAELSTAAKEKLGDLAKCAARMDALLNSILAYSRLTGTKPALEPVDANALVAEAIALIGQPAGFAISVEGDLPSFRGAGPRMLQVFVNLIGNAVKHHDRTEGKIVISGRDDGAFCEFRVRDDGPGIDPKFHARVFEMFKTLRSRDEVEGSGMGLAIVQKTIQKHGGRIWIEDNGADRGASFVFTVVKDPGDA